MPRQDDTTRSFSLVRRSDALPSHRHGEARAVFEALEHRRMLDGSSLGLLAWEGEEDDDGTSITQGILLTANSRSAMSATGRVMHDASAGVGARLFAEASAAAAAMPSAGSSPAGTTAMSPATQSGSARPIYSLDGKRVPVSASPNDLAADVDVSREPSGTTRPGPTTPANPDPLQLDNFTVFSAMRGENMPNFASAGIVEIHVSYWELYGLNPDGSLNRDHASEQKVRNIANKVADEGKLWVINIEHWPIDIRTDSQAEVTETMNKFIEIIGWAKDERPEVQVGIYRMGPNRDYWTPVHLAGAEAKAAELPNHPGRQQALAEWQDRFAEWQQSNDFLIPLMDAVDFVVPSLYTFYDDPANWVIYAEANMAEAARYGKPVLPFVWPRYHTSSPLVGQEIPGDFWQLQLDTISQHADGVIIWWHIGDPFDAGKEWWHTTVQFSEAVSGDLLQGAEPTPPATPDGGDGSTTISGTSNGTDTRLDS